MHYDFGKDVKDGDRGETMFACETLMRLAGNILYMEFNKDHRYDIKIGYVNYHRITYEVKKEMEIYKQTGNIFIEYENDGEKSGIWVTEAEYWVHVLEDRMFILTVKRLRELIAEKRYHKIGVGGDNDITKGYLFRINEFAKECTVRMINKEVES